MGILKDGRYGDSSYLSRLVDSLLHPAAIPIVLLLGYGPLLWMNAMPPNDQVGGAAFAYALVVTTPCTLLALILVVAFAARLLARIAKKLSK